MRNFFKFIIFGMLIVLLSVEKSEATSPQVSVQPLIVTNQEIETAAGAIELLKRKEDVVSKEVKKRLDASSERIQSVTILWDNAFGREFNQKDNSVWVVSTKDSLVFRIDVPIVVDEDGDKSNQDLTFFVDHTGTILY